VDVLLQLRDPSAPALVNVGTGVARSVAALLDAISLRVGLQHRVELIPAPLVDPSATLADTALLRSFTGHSLVTDLPGVVERYLLSHLTPMPA
jgi:UDP-glucose 4-epimerase